MDLNSINANINRLLTNIWAIISFFKEFIVDGAKDVSFTYINSDGSESVKTFPNISKMHDTFKSWLSDGVPWLRIGNGDRGTRTLNVKQWFQGGANTTTDDRIYIVTDIEQSQSRTFCYRLTGHLLNSDLAIDCVIVGYMYGSNGLVRVNASQSQVSAYVNADGFVTFKIDGDPYYATLTIDNIRDGNGGFCDVTDIVVSSTDI